MGKNSTEVVVAGAGLVGALAALVLARRGKSVLLLEQRPDPRRHGWAGGRSINLAISTRGLAALDRVGLRDQALRESIRMPGRRIHPSGGGARVFQAYGTHPHHAIHSISRGRLNEILLDAVDKESKVQTLFGAKMTGWDVQSGWSYACDGTTHSIPEGAFLFGCDGGGSVVRQTLVGEKAVQSREAILEYGYKELHIPPESDGGWRMEKEGLHIWPRGHFMLIALPNLAGSYTVTLFLAHHGPTSFEELKTKATVRTFFERYFPDVVPLIPNLEDDFFANPTGHMGTVRCSPWYSEAHQAALLGDAAHAIVPFFGQGMNCGFEDCSALDGALEGAAARSWGDIAQVIFEERKANADAIASMALENFVEMRDHVGNPNFLLQKDVEKLLETRFPNHYVSRYEMVSFSRIPYAVAWKAGEKQKEILAVLCHGIDRAKALEPQLDLSTAKKLIDNNLKEYFSYWEDPDGTWH